MTREELVAKIRTLAKDVYRGRLKADVAAAGGTAPHYA